VKVSLLGRQLNSGVQLNKDQLQKIEFVPDADWNTFAVHVGSMFLLKLLCGIDDMALLTALVGTKSRKHNNVNCLLYLTFILFIGGASWFIAQCTYKVLSNYIHDGFWTVERVSALICGTILILLGIREAYEDDVEGEVDEETEAVAVFETGASQLSFSSKKEGIIARAEPLQQTDDQHNGGRARGTKDVESSAEKEKKSHQKIGLFHYAWVIMMLAVDDCVVFTCMIQGTAINLVDVMLGMLLGSMLIVVVCRVLSSITCINSVLQQIPKWGLIVGLGCWVVLSGFVSIG